MTEPVPLRVLWLVAGFTVWSIAFIVLYSLQALGCAYDWGPTVIRLVVGVALAVHLAVLALMIRYWWQRPEAEFLDRVTLYTLWAAVVTTIGTFAPALALSTCAI